jgi:hypothetical protein
MAFEKYKPTNEEKMASASLAMTEEKASAIIAGFLSLVRGRSLVRLDFRLYGERECYLHDRNIIRRQTLAFDKAWREIAWRNKHDLACALIVASRHAFSGRIEYNHERASWSYCAGQYPPTEIRRAGELVAKESLRILSQ